MTGWWAGALDSTTNRIRNGVEGGDVQHQRLEAEC
jgi:hypothetical protein